jgi:hypothetical protein
VRERDINAKKFHRGHYEVIAARFRNALEPYMSDEEYTVEERAVRAAIVNLAISFAERLQADNEDFEPETFLNRCSPNAELYPMGDLWEVAQGND